MANKCVILLQQQGLKRRLSEVTFKTMHQQLVSIPTVCHTLSQIPEEIQIILDEESSWNFDVIQLERVSEKR